MVRWVQSRVNGSPMAATCEELFDPALTPLGLGEESSMLEVLDVALQCTRTAPAERPTSRRVSDLLLDISRKNIRRSASAKIGCK